MKIRLSVSDESYDEVKAFLEAREIEIDDDADYILLQRDKFPEHISVKDDRGTRLMISADDIIFIESCGRTMEIHTADAVYTSSERLYQLGNMLDPEKFLRISNSVIISVGQIKQIIPTFHMKFILQMKNNVKVDVTRNYYKAFKQFFGI